MVQSLPQSDGFRILFNSPELSEVQRSGFHLFLKKGIAEELSKISCIQLQDIHFLIEIVLDAQNFRLVPPENNYRDCILKMKSYTCKLYVQTKIFFKDKVSGELLHQTQPEWVLLADLPIMTKRGHFVINGSPRVIVHQVGRAPGVYFKKVSVLKKDVNSKARFYGDIIPRKGVWVRLQINKKGEIDLKLKKSKKVRAEMVQKCLELLEKSRSKPILFKGHKAVTSLNNTNQNAVPVSGYRFNLGMVKQSIDLQSSPFMLKEYAVAPLVRAPKQSFGIGSVLPCSIDLQSNHTKRVCALTQKQLFFSPQSSHLAGIDINNCFDSQTRQTQAFVIGFSRNKPQTVVHSIWYHARPWLRSIKETPTRVRMKPQFQKIFGSNKLIFVQPAHLFSKHVIKKRFALLHAKQLTKPSWNSGTRAEFVHTANGAKRLEFLPNNTVAKTSQSFQQKFKNHDLISIIKQSTLCLVKKPSLPFGAKMYGKKRSGFTKAEKQAFTDVYTSFYKNDIQDIKSRVSMSFGNRAKDLPKPDSLNSTLRSASKVSTQSKSQVLQKAAKKKVAKKPDVSIHLEKVRDYVCQLFKRSDFYDLGTVGREKINNKFGISVIETQLTALDIKSTINWLEKLRAGKEDIDDIDHSQNRRVRTSSELIQTQFSVGITRLKNGIAKKVRNGRIEQIKTLPLQKQSVYIKSQAQLIRIPQPSFGKVEVAKNLSVPNKVIPKLASVQTNLSRLQNKSIKTTTLGRSHFNGGGGCFVRRNTLLDQVKCHLQNRTTFTSINPYCITHQKKKRYYSALSFSQFTHKRSHFIDAKPWVRKNEGKQKRRYETRIDKATFRTSGNSFLNGNQKTRTGVPIDLAPQDVFHPQTNQLFNFSVSELFSTKPINGALREFFSSSALSQYMDQTNPLAEITHKRRISSLGVGGVSRESAGMAIRGIHPTHYGRICPIETPEGKNAGLVNSLAFYAKINNHGFIETPYYQVLKGQIQHELGFSFVSAGEESQNGFYIAPNDITQSRSKLLANNISTLESIPIRVADTILDLFKKVSPYKVDCIGISPVQILSVATSLIPFLEHNDANRALMGSNMQRQAVSLMISERPLVGTGLEARVLAESGHLVQSKVSGFVSSVSAHKVVVERLLQNLTWPPTLTSSSDFTHLSSVFDKGTRQPPSDSSLAKTAFNVLQKQSFCTQKRSFAKAKLLQASTTSFLHRLRLSTLLETGGSQRSLRMPSLSTFGKAKQWSVREPSLKKGKPLPYLGMFRYDQSNGVTDTLVVPTQSKESRASSLIKKRFALLPVTHSISTFSRSNQETCLIQKPLVKEGDWVQKGDMLSDCSAGQKGELSVGKNMLIAYIPWQGYNFEDAIVISDRLVKEQLYTSLHIERYTVVVNDFKDKVVDTNEWFTGNLPGVDSHKRNHLQKSGLPVIGTILREGDILVGKIKYSKKKPATPHEKLVCDILGEHNFSVQNSSLYVPKGVHEARVLTYKISQRFEKGLQNNCRPAGAPKVVHLFLGEKRNIQVGDKMSGRHGNKGIVSSILPKQDMPYLADGSPIDILLNPLGVPSRMNVGQVFECLLGLASTYLHQNFKVTSFDEAYGVEASQSLVFLKLYQARLQSGQNWLFQVNFPGKTRLTDGRSGECLDQWITVGRAYMLKLIHMVNEKIHARAIGPYALVTQQPLKGRAHKGGQRLGEMEVWAVEGFGAAYILQELLTKKSDDSIGRKEVLKAMLPNSASFLDFFDPFDQSIQTETRLGLANVEKEENRVHNKSQPFNVLGQPDIFKVLICELQALCLDVGVYSMKTESFQRQFLGILE